MQPPKMKVIILNIRFYMFHYQKQQKIFYEKQLKTSMTKQLKSLCKKQCNLLYFFTKDFRVFFINLWSIVILNWSLHFFRSDFI